MDREAALAQLPEAYAMAIALTESGADHPAIAARLGIEVESVHALLEVARLKLLELLGSDA